jgi:hypothetical protein
LVDGHEQMLRQILADMGSRSSLTCPLEEFRSRLENRKTGYMGALSLRVADDRALAEALPAPFVNLIRTLGGGP